ncbi:MAG: hypothetical protein LBD99_03965 [Candidatus Margulisbacteria bacterium]|jgi:hypothetical protein|nr:hypothetical protein [Candidatus Margulisiibacteriota bacterium]
MQLKIISVALVTRQDLRTAAAGLSAYFETMCSARNYFSGCEYGILRPLADLDNLKEEYLPELLPILSKIYMEALQAGQADLAKEIKPEVVLLENTMALLAVILEKYSELSGDYFLDLPCAFSAAEYEVWEDKCAALYDSLLTEIIPVMNNVKRIIALLNHLLAISV